MKREWTDKQLNVIKERNKNILVSAAAGSGKTSVLVERIINRVCDKNDPVDIDKLLIVTFTNAAAKEMKARIYKGLEERAHSNPYDMHLKKQSAYIFNAHISTIDSFCGYIFKNYFHEIGADPALKIADSGDLAIIANEVLETLLEEYYTKADEDFLEFTDAFAKKDRDDTITEMILKLSAASESYPWQDEWLEAMREAYIADTIEELNDSKWMKAFLSHTDNIVSALMEESEELCEKFLELGHPYLKAAQEDKGILSELSKCKSYEDYYKCLNNIHFAKLSGAKCEAVTKEEREALKAKRDAIKEEIKKIGEDFSDEPDELLSDIRHTRGYMDILVQLTKEFRKRYSDEKQNRGLMDFSDVEHYALNILIDKDTHKRTATAEALSREFKEVIIDEYQDSNYLQEMLLSAICNENKGSYDYFMVGDVKQSIYRFRQARPEIFIKKYAEYKNGKDGCVCIDLDKNFRSRKEVLLAANAVFEAVMKPDLGDVDYDEAARLKVGAGGFPKTEEDVFKCELIMADSADAADLELHSKEEYEATVIATKIKEVLRIGYVTEKDGSLRRPKLSDIVILHRSANTIANTYRDVLKSYEIPAVVLSKSGYFSSTEIEVFLALLRLLSNPRQDIAMAAVMHSKLFDFSDDEMTLIRMAAGDEPFCEGVIHIAKSDTSDLDENLHQKIIDFYDTIEAWRDRAGKLPLYSLIDEILKETGYMSYITALPEGNIRRDNMEKLISLAAGFEEMEFSGLFNFVRYIERLKKYEQDIPVSATSPEDAVSIMTIHSSKGLEFPIVILAGCGRSIIPKADSLVISPDLGAGFTLFDPRHRTKKNTLIKSFLAQKNAMDDKGEELRLLYVAMTRAKEKLILTAVGSKMSEKLDSTDAIKGLMPLTKRMRSTCYLDWILPVAKNRTDAIKTEYLSAEDLIISEARVRAGADIRIAEIEDMCGDVSEEQRDAFDKEISFSYPHKISNDTKIKYSVSELKRRAMEEAIGEDDGQSIFASDDTKEYVPLFISGKSRHINGAVRGTAMHRYMECFDFSLDEYKSSYESELSRMSSNGLLLDDERELIVKNEIEIFLKSGLCERMHKAAIHGTLRCEAAFIMGDVPSHFIDEADESDDEPILVQGIIDAFFEEDDGIVLVDYKTDRIDKDTHLVARYKKQMHLYKDAIERTHEKKVKDIILYSFCLGREVYV